MAEKLVIVESPAKAKTINKFLGKGYKVIASNGHVRDLPKSQLGVDVENGFEPKYITLRGRGDVLEKIRKEGKAAAQVFLATDPDREGEAISWHLAHILKMDQKQKCRIVFNEITPNAIKEAIKTPRCIDSELVDAQQARRVLDRLVGYKISPILWAKICKGLSAGRVQSVASRIICDREEEIRNFIPEEYWSLAAALASDKEKKGFEAKLHSYKGKKLAINSLEQVTGIMRDLASCSEKEIEKVEKKDETLRLIYENKQKGGREYKVTDVKRAPKTRHPAPPFTTSNLQQEASRKLNFTTKRTMMVAQQLYEGIDIGKSTIGLVTYIRTDSVRIAESALAQVREMIQELYGEKYLPAKPNFYKGKKGAQDAHEAIRPTHMDMTPQSLKEKITPEQYKLYKLIYDRFVASQMTDAIYDTMNVTLQAGDYTFKATGSKLVFDGFMRQYIEGTDFDDDEKSTMLPDMAVGDIFAYKKLTADQSFTQPPMRFTEASLVKTLEELGIGRPSTYSPTISTIIDRGYVKREKKALFPTELGELVTKLMKENFKDIVDVKFTANMEAKLDDVEEGKVEWKEVIKDFYDPFKEILEKAEKTIEKVKIEDQVSDVPCDKCGAMMVYKVGRFGKFLACPRFPECRNAKPILQTIDVPCPKCGARLIKRSMKKRNKNFYGCERYPECDFVSWDLPVKEKCPKCGSMMVQKLTKAGKQLQCTNESCKHIIKKGKEAKQDDE